MFYIRLCFPQFTTLFSWKLFCVVKKFLKALTFSSPDEMMQFATKVYSAHQAIWPFHFPWTGYFPQSKNFSSVVFHFVVFRANSKSSSLFLSFSVVMRAKRQEAWKRSKSYLFEIFWTFLNIWCGGYFNEQRLMGFVCSPSEALMFIVVFYRPAEHPLF